jgi:environmental stress-induced protein Ves
MPATPRITLLPASAHRDMPWKNGLGRTAEIAREPASGESFDWRVSIATIAADGAFSAFPGCDRTLVPIAGGGLALDFADGTGLVGQLFEPMRFAGDAPCDGRLLAGPARDLNVITRRTAMRHHVELVAGPHRTICAGTTTLVVALDHPLCVAAGDGRQRLDPGDVLRIDGAGLRMELEPGDPHAHAALITLERATR